MTEDYSLRGCSNRIEKICSTVRGTEGFLRESLFGKYCLFRVGLDASCNCAASSRCTRW